MSKRTPEEFKEAAAKRGLNEWVIRRCSMCNYPLSFVFSGDFVGFDSGCDCVTYHTPLKPCSWADIAKHYNMQNHEDVIKEMNQFWFPTEEVPYESKA